MITTNFQTCRWTKPPVTDKLPANPTDVHLHHYENKRIGQ